MKRVLTLALMAASACGGDGGAGPGSGQTAVYLSDAPFPFDEVGRVDIHIVRVDLTMGDTVDVGSTWLTVAEPDRSFNLLELHNGATTLLGSAEVPPGHYGAVRIQLDTDLSSITMADGTVLRGVVGDQEGILWQSNSGRPLIQALVFEPVPVAENGADIVIDFDAGRSFLVAGPNRFIFSPFILAVNRRATGSISGTAVATPEGGGEPIPVANATVEAFFAAEGSGGFPAATGRTDASGDFTIAFLASHSYTVRATGTTAAGLRVGELAGIGVEAGGTAAVGAILLDTEPGNEPPPPIDSTGT